MAIEIKSTLLNDKDFENVKKSLIKISEIDGEDKYRVKTLEYINDSSTDDDDQFFFDMLEFVRFLNPTDESVAYTTPDKRIFLNCPKKEIKGIKEWDFIYDHECLHQLWDTFGVQHRIEKEEGSCDHMLLNIASDCVINDYLYIFRKKERPDNLITPEYLKENYNVEYDNKNDTQYTLYLKLNTVKDKIKNDKKLEKIMGKIDPKSVKKQTGPQPPQPPSGNFSDEYKQGRHDGIKDVVDKKVDPLKYSPKQVKSDYDKGYNDVLAEIKKGMEEGITISDQQQSGNSQNGLEQVPWNMPKQQLSGGNDGGDSSDKNDEGNSGENSQKSTSEKAQDAANRAKKSADAAEEAANSAGNDGDDSGDEKKDGNGGSSKSDKEAAANKAKEEAEKAQDAANKSKEAEENGDMKAADQYKKEAEEHANAAEKAAKEAGANMKEKGSQDGDGEDGEGQGEGGKGEAGNQDASDNTETEEDLEKIKHKAEDVIKKYKEKITGTFGQFIAKCKKSVELNKSGMAISNRKAAPGWNQQMNSYVNAFVKKKVFQKKRQFKKTYSRVKRGSGFIEYGKPIKPGKKIREEKLTINTSFYIDRSGSMGGDPIKNVFKAAYTISDILKKQFSKEKVVDEISFKMHAFDYSMHELKWGNTISADGGTMDFDRILEYIKDHTHDYLINIIITDAQFNINKDEVDKFIKDIDGMILFIANSSNNTMKELSKKYNTQLFYVEADNAFTIK